MAANTKQKFITYIKVAAVICKNQGGHIFAGQRSPSACACQRSNNRSRRGGGANPSAANRGPLGVNASSCLRGHLICKHKFQSFRKWNVLAQTNETAKHNTADADGRGAEEQVQYFSRQTACGSRDEWNFWDRH